MHKKFTEKDIDNLYLNIGKKVKELREKNNMTQLELSYAMGYKSVSLVSSAELYTKKKHFNLEHLYKISKILGIEMYELIPQNKWYIKLKILIYIYKKIYAFFKIGMRRNLSLKYSILVNFLIGIPFAYIGLLSRIDNIFEIKEHSYIEHFLYGVFGIPCFLGILFLISLTIIVFFKKVYKIKYYIPILMVSIFLIFLSYFSEFHRIGNKVNHFNFDLFSIFMGTLLFLYVFKNKNLYHY